MGRQGIKSKNDKQHSLLKRMLMLSQAAQNESAKVILLSSTTDSIYLSSLVAVALEAGLHVVGLPLSISPFQVKEMPFQIKHSTQLKSTLR
jgi:electron transfer flavoprotein alpha subunit